MPQPVRVAVTVSEPEPPNLTTRDWVVFKFRHLAWICGYTSGYSVVTVRGVVQSETMMSSTRCWRLSLRRSAFWRLVGLVRR